MTLLIKKYINTEKINEIVKVKNFDDVTFSEFIRFLDNCLAQDEKYGIDEKEDHQASTLKYVNEYIDEFISERRKGFSLEWVKEFVHNSFFEGNQNSSALAYDSIKKINLLQAQKDLELYAKLTNRDNLFVNHFIYILEMDVPNTTPSVEEQADKYSRIYKKQIQKGKSEIFAHKYSELFTKYHEIYCEDYALAYEKAITENKSFEYADTFATKYANELVEVKRRVGLHDDYELINFKIEKVNGYMKGWEYAKNLEMKDCERFLKIYEDALQTYFNDDKELIKVTAEEIDKAVLEIALKRYNRYFVNSITPR